MAKKNSYWITAYLPFDGSEVNPNHFLIEGISPVIYLVLENRWAEQYFFIRYGDKLGPHIRLRFSGNADLLENKVKPLLRTTFPGIRFAAYHQEYTRYGGKIGMQIAQKLFQSSSNAVLSYLSEHKDVSYEQSLGLAMQLNLSMVHALGMDKKQAAAFFKHLVDQRNIATYKNMFAPQQATVTSHLHSLWSMLENHQTVNSEWFSSWQKELTEIYMELQSALQKKELFLDPQKKHNELPMWYLYESYEHMNNNRLGIVTADEPYMSYILYNSLLAI